MPEKVLEFIADIYIEDKTRIKLGKEKYIEMNIQNGIRQGCTASTVLFKLITYKIFEELEHKCKGIIYGRRNVMCLFFADDGLLISNNLDEAKHQIKILNSVAKKYGLEINRDKSKCLIYNMESKPRETEEIEVVQKIKYLGLIIQDKKDILDKQRERIVGQIRKLGNMSYSIIMKSGHRVLIGKTYWKSIVLPSALCGAELITLRELDIAEIRKWCLLKNSECPIICMHSSIARRNWNWKHESKNWKNEDTVFENN